MSYTILYQSDGGVITTYTGIVTDEEMLSSARERTRPIEKVDSYKYLLTDFTNVSNFEVSSAGVRLIADLTSKMVQQNPEIRMAIVLPTDLQFGMGRMWQALTEEGEATAVVVRTMDEAVKWLKTCLG